MTSFFRQQLLVLLISLPGTLLCLAVHEAAHGLVAYGLGDPTAKNAGRLTLDPIRHLDPLGTICLLFFHVGWAKPVPINTNYFKNKRVGIALVSLAGPLSNFVLAAVLLFVRQFVAGSDQMLLFVLNMMLYYGAIISIGLGVFNLIPVPPLDGSKILYSFLPWDVVRRISFYEQWVQFFLFALLLIGVLDVPISFCTNGIFSFLYDLVTIG